MQRLLMPVRKLSIQMSKDLKFVKEFHEYIPVWHAELQLRKARQANRDAQKRPLKEDRRWQYGARTEPVGVLDDLFEAAEETPISSLFHEMVLL
eukprot:g30948.t1